MKGLFLDFAKDNIEFTLVYFLNTAVLIIFFYLFYENAEILYPLSLSVFIFLITIVIKCFRYKAFNVDIDMAVANAEYKVRCFTREQKRAFKGIKNLHLTYENKISSIKVEEKEQRRLISQFIHSLKAPVTVIDIAASNILEESALSDIKIESSKITSTLDNLLSILRLEEFEMDYSSEPINLKDSLNSTINSLKRNFIYGKVIPKVKCSCEEPIVYTDDKWNKIMLQQFISNGIKYSLPGESMKPLFFNIDKDNDHVTLVIRDEGIGIPEYDLDRIMEAFFTGENGKKVKNSSGIGLYIAKKISEKLDHKIEIKSTQQQGTEIKITYLSKV